MRHSTKVGQVDRKSTSWMWNTLSPGSDIDGSGGSTPVTGTSLGEA